MLQPVAAPANRLARPQRVGCAAYCLLLTLLFGQPLTRLAAYAAQSDLFSYILLTPFIFGYLLYIGRRPSAEYRRSIAGTAALGTLGIAAVAAGIKWGGSLSVNDGLALKTLALASFVAAGGFLFFGSKWMAGRVFPFAFLVFMVPLPDAVVNWLETASVSASSEAAAFFFSLSGTPVARQGTVFELPGIVIRVGQECSGIHSSWVLFITSLLAAHVFLRSPWRRALLVAFVIPLGILRNGFRILVIGLLCVYRGPYMIDSSIHRKGGPLFFALSLIPFSLLLWWLRRREQRMSRPD